MNATSALTYARCANCGRPASDRYCGFDDCMLDLAQSVGRRRAWATRWTTLAVLFATASAVLTTFFQRDDWQAAVLRWSFEYEHYSLAVAVYTGAWGGLSWQGWAAVGFTVSGGLIALSVLLRLSAGRVVQTAPGLKLVVKQQRSDSGAMQILGALLIIPLIIVCIGIIVGVAAASSDDHHHRWH